MKSVSYPLISDVCALVIGVLLVWWPQAAVIYLVITVGVLFLIPGALGLLGYLMNRSKKSGGSALPVVALGSTLFGLWLMIMPEFFVSILMYVLGVLLVLAGIAQLSNLSAARSWGHVPWGMFVIPSLVLVAGLVVLFNPFQAATVPFIILGASSIVYALTDLFRILRYRKREESRIEDVNIIEEIKDKPEA